MKWKPWEKYSDISSIQEQLSIPEITEPPCKNCEHFKPVRKIDTKGCYDGVSLCANTDMFSDFSCYVAKKTEAAK